MSRKDANAKVVIFGHFGSQNSGNESTLIAFIAQIRARTPEVQLCCVCTNPEAVAAREGIVAEAITTRRPTGGAPLVKVVKVACSEAGQYLRAFRILRRTETLVIPGTGLVTDAFGLQGWGPYSLLKWVLVAKLRRTRVLFVSIGAGPFYTPIGRTIVRASLSLADYRSYRDLASRDSLRAIGFPAERDPVYPDLVFGLPASLLPPPRAMTSARPTIGIGLMADQGRYSAAEPQAVTYSNYLDSMARFAEWLLDHDYDIRVFIGDGAGDQEAVHGFRTRLQDQFGDLDNRVTEQGQSPQAVLAGLAETDVMVATRFHNVLLSLLMNRPVIAISFHHKCSSLMRQMHLSEYCHEIDQLDADRLIGQFESMQTEVRTMRRTISTKVDEARGLLDEQYNLLFGGA